LLSEVRLRPPAAPADGQADKRRGPRAFWALHGSAARRSASKRYLVAFLSSAAALVVNLWAPPSLQQAALFYAAVAVSAWYGGLGPGLVAAFASTLAQAFVEVSPGWDLSLLDSEEYLRAAVFLLVAILTGGLTESLRWERTRAEAARERAITSSRALQLEKRRTETILQSVSDGITVQDASGRLVYANDAAARLLGHEGGSPALADTPAEEIYARLELIDEEGRPLPPASLPPQRALSGEDTPERLVSFTAPGSETQRWALVSARPIRDGSGRVVMAVSAIHDLTERILHERALEENASDLQQLTARLESMVEQLRVERESAFAARTEAEVALDRILTLQRVTAALSEARTPDEVAEVVLERGIEALDARSGVLLAFTGDGESVEVVRAAGVAPERLAEWSRSSPLDLSRLTGALRRDELTSTGSPVASSGVPSADALRRALGTESLAMVPVSARDRPLGVLAFDVHGRSALEPRDRDLLLALGRQCAQALDRARLFADERAARDEAEQASRAKSQFLALMSHELRTPLNAILGYEELLETEISGPISGVQRQHLSRIRESTRHLLTLIEQILSLSRVQSGKHAVHLDDVDAVGLVREAVAMVEPKLRRKGVALELDFPEEGMAIRTDAGKLRQILLNVLSNAVKFTEQGAVQVALSREDHALRFTVRDTGRGIEDQHREQVFEPFVQLSGDGVLPTGTGLGLAVARELARHLGGDITLESEPGEGSAFTILVPYEAPEPEDALSEDGDRLDARVDA
jgi:signal transduction histidine kinase/PAS domain-containing protein